MKAVKEVRKFLRFDERAKVSFALVAVLVLMLSTVSMVYIAAINRKEREREREDDTTSTMESKVNVLQTEIETQAYILAMNAIYKATQDENDQNRIVPIFEKDFEKYLRKYTDDDGFEEGDFFIRVKDYTVSLNLDSKISDNYIPIADPGVTEGGKLDGVDIEKPEGMEDTPTNCYYNLDGNLNYRVTHKDSQVALDKNMSFSRSIETPYPILQNKFSQFNNNAQSGSSELGRIIQYILVTIAQYRVLQGYGASEIEGIDFNVGGTNEIITYDDIELAVNLAILLESAKLYRDFDPEHLKEFAVNSGETEKSMASLINTWITEDQIDGADIIALYKGIESREINLEMLLGQAIYSLMDQFILKYLNYFGFIDLLDAIWQVAQVGWNAIEGFFGWFAGLFPQEDKRAEIAKEWAEEQLLDSMLDSLIMFDVPVTIDQTNYEIRFDDEDDCTHMEDTDNNASTPDEPVDYRWTILSKYTVIIPSSTETADFEQMDIMREAVDNVWIDFYETYFNDSDDNIVRSLSQTLKEIVVGIAGNIAQLDGLRELFAEYRHLPSTAVKPNDDVSLLSEISIHVTELMDKTAKYFRSEEGKDGINELLHNLISDHNKMLYGVSRHISDRFDEFADKSGNIEIATERLTDALMENARVIEGSGTITKVDNPEDIKYPDLPPEPIAEPGLLPRRVPYIHQVYDTPGWFNGHWACGATSAMMALGYYEKIPANDWGNFICESYTYKGHTYNVGQADPNGRIATGGYGFITQQNWRDTKGFMAQYARQHGLDSSVDWSPTWGELTAEIDAGHPVVLLTSLTGPGHYVLAVGYDTNSQVVIVNDPYGNKNQGYINYNGASVEYDWPGNNFGHSNLNKVHCFIYFKGNVPDTRSRGDVTPDEWMVMQCPYDEHPAMDANSLPKRSDSEILDRFDSTKRDEVRAYARSVIESAYVQVKNIEISEFEGAMEGLSGTTKIEILDMIIDGVATVGHASGLLPVACEFVSRVAANITYSAEMRNVEYFLPISMGTPFKFWSGENTSNALPQRDFRGENNIDAALKKGKVAFESIDVNIKPDYLLNNTKNLKIVIEDPEGVHYTNLTEFHSRPFETTWEIKISGSFTLTTKSERKDLVFNGEHLAVGKTDTITLNISTPITVYSGWNLESVDYWETSTLWGDIAALAIKFLTGLWDAITGVIGWLVDGLMKVLTVLVNILHAIVNFASKIIKVIVDVFTWVLEKIRGFIQGSMNIIAKAILGISLLLGDNFNFSAFGILFNVTTLFPDGDIPADGWEWMSRISSRFQVKSFGFGFDVSVVRKVGTEDYDILITSGLKIGDFILEVAMDPLMAVWPRFIEGYGVYLNETGQGFGLEFTSPEIDTGWSVLGSVKVEKGSVKKVIKIPASKVTIPYVGTVSTELGVKLSWPTKVKLDGKKIAAKLNESFYEVWHGLGGQFPMNSSIINEYSEKLLESFKENLGPVLVDLGSDVKLKVWIKMDIKPFGGRFKVAGLSGYTVWTTKLQFETNLGKDIVKTIDYFKAYSNKYLEDPGQRPKKEPLPETGVDVKFSTEAKVQVKKIFSSPVTIPVIGVQAKGEVGFKVSCKYIYREEVTTAWKNIKASLAADWEEAKAGQSMKNLADKAKGLLEYLGDNIEFKTWMKLHLSRDFGSYGDLAATINVDFIIKGKDTVIDGFNWIKSNIDKYLINPGENVTASPPPNVIIRFYVTTEIGIRHKVAKIPIPAIGCTADVTIGFKFTLKFKETTNLSNFIDFMNGSFDEVDNETNSTPRDENLITIYAQKIIAKFKAALDYILDNGQISFYVRFDLDVGGLDALEAGVVLKFIMKCSLRGVWEVAKWIMGNIGAFVNNILNPANAARYPDVPKEYLEKIHIEFEAFLQAGLPDMIKDVTGGMVGFKARLSLIIRMNLPLIGAFFGQDWGRYVAVFGLVLKLDLTIKIGIENLFDFMDVEMHPHAWFRLWFFRGRVYEIE